MPMYEFVCRKCNLLEEHFHKMSEEKREHDCPECSEPMDRIFCTNFNIKDGITGPTPSKANRENKYRERRSKIMDKKQRETHSTPKLVPNVQNKEGKPEIFDSWKEASKFAKSEGKSEKSFKQMIAKEKKK